MAQWVQKATSKNKGKFSAKAKKAGESTHQYAEAKKNAKGALGHEARLALTLESFHKR